MKNLLTSLSLLVAFITTTRAQTTPVPDMVKVDGGTFSMGSNSSDAFIDERPLHSVTVSSFSIAKYLTTVAQYKAFCTATNRPMPNPPTWGWSDKSPIVSVSYDDAVAYCNWLGQTYGGSYRLPTEAEWEYAARGGNKTNGYTYSGSNVLDEVGWDADNSNGKTNAVGWKKANELGLYDMSGNVGEWCSDWYDENYYNTSPSANPKGPDSGTAHVLRGGSFLSAAPFCRIAARANNNPSSHLNYIGFRMVSSQ